MRISKTGSDAQLETIIVFWDILAQMDIITSTLTED